MTADDDDHGTPEQPWHHSTPAVLGASVAALAVIALVVWGVVALTGEADKPQDAPINFVDPTFSSTLTKTTASTTPTITSTRPPLTSEIMGPADPSAGSSTPPSDSTSGSTTPSTSPPWTSHELPTTRETENGDATTQTRNRPRTNVTRTLYPAPGN